MINSCRRRWVWDLGWEGGWVWERWSFRRQRSLWGHLILPSLDCLKPENEKKTVFKCNTPKSLSEHVHRRSRATPSLFSEPVYFYKLKSKSLIRINTYATMPEERLGGGEPDCFWEHYITWRGLILFLQQISQIKKRLITDCISQNALEVMEALQTWYCRRMPVWYNSHVSILSILYWYCITVVLKRYVCVCNWWYSEYSEALLHNSVCA